MKIFSKLISLAMISILGSSLAAYAATGKGKVALVIGNGAYENAPDLPNPPNDARAMASLLRSLGFLVVEGIDLDKSAMGDLVDEFTEKAYEADVGLVFYAGHGMQVGGKNYLIPVDAKLSSPAHLRTRTIEISSIVDSLPVDPSIGVVILDACRDNPLARSLARSMPATRSQSIGTGLAAVQVSAQGDGTGGTLIAYSTDPGAVALDGENSQNSPYTQALLKHLSTPGIELQSALTRVRGEVATSTEGRQRPWHNASLGREVFLGGKLQQPVPVAQAPAPAGTVVAALPPATGAASNDAATAIRTTVQNNNWEIESRFWDEATKRNTIGHYEAYLAQYPSGKFAAIAALNITQLKKKAAATQTAAVAPKADSAHSVTTPTRAAIGVTDEIRATPGTAISEASIRMSRNDKRDLQRRLTALGHSTGGADGKLGPKSRRAVGAWQRANGIVETQMLTPSQWAVLQVQSDPLMEQIRRREAAAAAARKKSRDARRTTTSKTRTATTRQRSTKKRKYRDPEPSYSNRRNSRRRSGKTKAFVGGAILGAGAAIITCKAIRGC